MQSIYMESQWNWHALLFVRLVDYSISLHSFQYMDHIQKLFDGEECS